MDAVVQIGADVRQALRGIDQLNRRLNNIDRATLKSSKSMKRLETAASGVSTALRTATVAFAGFAATRGLQGILDATQRMEGFRTQLTTYLGSQQLANAELERLSKLARSLPQDVDELTQAFVIFNRYGIDTSNESMRAFSNIAAANSKSIIQFGEAVADAMTGEFERLKEFGIKVSTENGKYTARIGEDQVAVATTTKSLVDQLKALGEEGGRFGSVTVGPLTMALSNFRGAVFEASAALGSGGLGLAISDTVNQITELLTKNDEAVTAIGDGLTKAFLYAVEAGKFLFNNIELIAKAFGILLAIKATTWVYGAVAAFGTFAVTLGRTLIPALVILGKVLRATALLALRHPLIGAIALIVGGIEYLTGAVSGLAEKFGLIGDDSALEGLLNDAKGLTNELTGGVSGAMDEFSGISGRVEEQFANIKERAAETTEKIDEATAATERQRLASEAAARAEQEKADQIKQILTDRLEETRIAGLTADEQLRIKLEKELTNKFGEEAVANAQAELDAYIAQNRELERARKFHEDVVGIQRQIVELSSVERARRNDILDTVEASLRADYERLQSYANTNEEIKNLEMELTFALLDVENRKKQIYEDTIQYRMRIAEEARRHELAAELRQSKLLGDVANMNNMQRIGYEEKIQGVVSERIAFEKKSETEKAQWAISQGAEVFNQLGTYNKKAFEAAKAFNIANAIMNTYMGATKALATYPPPFNFIAAAAVVAAGLAQVASIRSQSYSGRQLGGPVMNGTSYIVGENGPEMFTPTTNGRITRNGDLNTGGPVNINFNITANDASGFDDLLLQRKGMITQMVSDAMTDRGQRSML